MQATYANTPNISTAHKATLLEKLNNKTAKIGIVGLGYVGLPLILRYASVGYSVLGFDIDQKKIDALKSGKSYIEHINAKDIADAFQTKADATTDFSHIRDVDAVILCVPTPLTKHRDPDLSFILNTMTALLPYLHNGMAISLESTTFPGTTDEILAPMIEEKGFRVGEDLYLIFSPEREDPGNKNFNTQTIPKIVGGCTPDCADIGQALYKNAVDKVVMVSSARTAEMTKLLENIHRAVNIGLVNEMKIVADKMGIDIYEVIDAAATKPFGFTAFYPGPGLGGHCIPIDPYYLTWKAREYGLNTRFIELSGEVNRAMPDYVIGKLVDALNNRGKAIKDAKILILGIAYKKDVDDMRESPAVEIMEILRDKGANLSYCDPHVQKFPKMRQHNFDLTSITLTAENLASYDAVLLATNHTKFDYDLILKHANLIIDSRGIYRTPNTKIVRA